jgi:gamma-glutamyl-gamma-aminobutyrate hydrolase PuuD
MGEVVTLGAYSVPHNPVRQIVVVGDRSTSYLTHRELDAALELFPPDVHARWVGTDTPDASDTSEADGVWVVPGSPYRNDSTVYAAITMARTSGQPFLGTCGGLQYAVVEFARNVAHLTDADHAETAPAAKTLVIDRLSCSLIAQERRVTAIPGTRMQSICGSAPFVGFHWCNFGVAPAYEERLAAHGLIVGARADDAGVEAIELLEHPFFLATLFQPQIGSLRDRRLHPVIQAFVAAVRARAVPNDLALDENRIRQTLRKAWSASSRTKWTAERPALGQCSPTALVIQDHFGGTLLKTCIEGAWHFYNCIDWRAYDFAVEQFEAEPTYEHQRSSRAEAFLDCTADQYSALAERFAAVWPNLQGP